MNERTYCLYRIENVENGKVYIGQSVDVQRRWSQHRKTLNDTTHTNGHLQRAWDKYGSGSFTFSVIDIYDTLADVNTAEELHITVSGSMSVGVYNIAKGGDNYSWTDERKAKLSIAMLGNTRTKGKPLTEEHRMSIREALMGKKHSPETRAKIGDAHKGRKHSPETIAKLKAKTYTDEYRRNMSAIKTGVTFSDEHKAKLSAARKGKRRRPFSDEARANMSAARKGKKHSLETRAKISESWKNRKSAKPSELNEE